jgi:hypothetical protein
MPNVPRRGDSRKTTQLDLFSWVSPGPVSTPDWIAARIARRFGLTVETACNVARLAGIGSEASR